MRLFDFVTELSSVQYIFVSTLLYVYSLIEAEMHDVWFAYELRREREKKKKHVNESSIVSIWIEREIKSMISLKLILHLLVDSSKGHWAHWLLHQILKRSVYLSSYDIWRIVSIRFQESLNSVGTVKCAIEKCLCIFWIRKRVILIKSNLFENWARKNFIKSNVLVAEMIISHYWNFGE